MRGLLQKKVGFETFLPLVTFLKGWYVLEKNEKMKNHKRTNLPKMYLTVGMFRNELSFASDPR